MKGNLLGLLRIAAIISSLTGIRAHSAKYAATQSSRAYETIRHRSQPKLRKLHRRHNQY